MNRYPGVTGKEVEMLYSFLHDDPGTNLKALSPCCNTASIESSQTTTNMLMYSCLNLMWLYAEENPSYAQPKPLGSYPDWVQDLFFRTRTLDQYDGAI